MPVIDYSLLAWWPLDEENGNLAQEKVSGSKDPVSYVFNNPRYKPASDPLWKPGVKSGALLFDGYSTWITRAAATMPVPDVAMSIEVWIAPRAFEPGLESRLSAIVNQHNREARQGYIFGLYRHGTWSLQVGAGGEWLEIWCEEPLIPRDCWSYLVATFEGTTGCMSLYLNGEEVASKDVTAGIRITPCNTDFLIGKNNQAANVEKVFTSNMINAVLDEIKIYNRALSPQEIAANYASYLACYPDGQLPQPDVLPDRSRYNGDPYRPQYHFVPEHWMNEPHAPLYFNGLYHIFYQSNPNGPFWQNIHWGHAVSPDLVHWRDLPPALTPGKDEVDPDGDWSGSAVVDDGVPTLLFTAGDNTKSPNQAVAIARSTFKQDGDNDLTRWVKDKEPVIVQKEGIGRFGEFRDPFGWKDGDTWYVLVGSGIPDVGGTALLYSSPDLHNWTYHGPFYSCGLENYPKTGEVWELPVFLPLGQDKSDNEKYLLLVNPWFKQGSPYYEYYCKYIFYWIGTWDKANHRFLPDQEEPQVFDLGEHAIGPSGMVDPQGRLIVFTIVWGGFKTTQIYDLGWVHNAGLPVILKLREDGQLGVEPLPELQSLRQKELVSFEEKTQEEANRMLEGVGGKMLEIFVQFEAKSTGRYGLKVCATPDGEEETLIYFDAATSTLKIDRSRSSRDSDLEHKEVGGELPLAGQPLQLHIFVDHSMVEVYANGLKSLTTRVYPVRDDALGLRLWADNPVDINMLQVWQLGSSYQP